MIVTEFTDCTSFLWGWVSTQHPGYRALVHDRTSGGGTTSFTVASGYYRWPDYIAAVNTAVASKGTCVLDSRNGKVQLSFGANTDNFYTWTDRIGWLLGFGAGAGDTSQEGGTGSAGIYSSFIPPAGIPLYGATWTEIDMVKERSLVLDRVNRAHGYAFGHSRMWRWEMMMSKHSAFALKQGWCLHGKVTISGHIASAYAAAGAWSKTNPDGYLDAYVVGLESLEFIDRANETAKATLIVASGV